MTSPNASTRPDRKKVAPRAASQRSLNAGLGGIGGGTGLVAIAQTVGVHTVLGQTLLYVAPAISVVAGAIFFQLKLQADWYNERWQIARARNTLVKQLKNPHTSDDYKTEIKIMLEDLDRAVAATQLARVRLIEVSRR